MSKLNDLIAECVSRGSLHQSIAADLLRALDDASPSAVKDRTEYDALFALNQSQADTIDRLQAQAEQDAVTISALRVEIDGEAHD